MTDPPVPGQLDLDPALIDAIASRLIDPLCERLTVALTGHRANASAEHTWVDAAEMARRLDVTREWVYEHAHELGAVRIGHGPRPRLRFPPGHAAMQTKTQTGTPRRTTPRDRAAGLIAIYDG